MGCLLTGPSTHRSDPCTLDLVRVLLELPASHSPYSSGRFTPDMNNEFCVLSEVLLDSDQLSLTRVILAQRMCSYQLPFACFLICSGVPGSVGQVTDATLLDFLFNRLGTHPLDFTQFSS